MTEQMTLLSHILYVHQQENCTWNACIYSNETHS